MNNENREPFCPWRFVPPYNKYIPDVCIQFLIDTIERLNNLVHLIPYSIHTHT